MRDMATGLWTKPDKDKLIICSAYLDQTGEINLDITKLEKIREYAATQGYELIIMGDMNAHSTLWGKQRNIK